MIYIGAPGHARGPAENRLLRPADFERKSEAHPYDRAHPVDPAMLIIYIVAPGHARGPLENPLLRPADFEREF